MQQDMVGREKQMHFYIAMIEIMGPNTKHVVKHVHDNGAWNFKSCIDKTAHKLFVSMKHMWLSWCLFRNDQKIF